MIMRIYFVDDLRVSMKMKWWKLSEMNAVLEKHTLQSVQNSPNLMQIGKTLNLRLNSWKYSYNTHRRWEYLLNDRISMTNTVFILYVKCIRVGTYYRCRIAAGYWNIYKFKVCFALKVIRKTSVWLPYCLLMTIIIKTCLHMQTKVTSGCDGILVVIT